MNKIVLFVFLIFFGTCLIAQEKTNRVELSSVSINFGSISNSNNFDGNTQEFTKLAPNSLLLEEISDSDIKSYTYNFDFGTAFNANLHFSVKNKQGGISKYYPQLRVGITYSDQIYISQDGLNTEEFRVDTLTSNRNGNTFYIDSVQEDSYLIEYGADQLLIDISYLIGSNPANRLSIYGGVGLSFGFTFNASTEITLTEGSYFLSDASYIFTNSLEQSFESKQESFSNKSGFSSMMSIPFGLEYRLSKKENAWGNCRLYFEGRPGINYITIPELESKLITSAFWGLGFKYDF